MTTLAKYTNKTAKINVYAAHKSETVKQTEQNLERTLGEEKKTELVLRMNFNALLTDMINTNSMELQNLMKQTGKYQYTYKQQINQIVDKSKKTTQRPKPKL